MEEKYLKEEALKEEDTLLKGKETCQNFNAIIVTNLVIIEVIV